MAFGFLPEGLKWTPLVGQCGSVFKVESDIVVMLPVRAGYYTQITTGLIVTQVPDHNGTQYASQLCRLA